MLKKRERLVRENRKVGNMPTSRDRFLGHSVTVRLREARLGSHGDGAKLSVSMWATLTQRLLASFCLPCEPLPRGID